MTNPEQRVLDTIDELVDQQLAVGPVDDYSVNRYDRCSLCGDQWHGLTSPYGCPGDACSDEERQAYLDRPTVSTKSKRPCPRLRFWANSPDGMVQAIEGNMQLVGLDDGVVTLQLLPPVVEHSDPADGTEQDLDDDLISVGQVIDDHFHPLGYIHGDDIVQNVDHEYVHSWQGTTVRSSSTWTIQFPVEYSEVNPELFDVLLGRSSA